MKIILALLAVVALVAVVSGTNGALVYLAQGDPAWILEPSDGGSCWLFPKNEVGALYDIPARSSGPNLSYCGITGEQSANMKEGQYTMLYVTPATVNGRTFKDVSWVNNSLVSTFNSAKPIDESGRLGPMVMADLYAMIEGNGLNTITDTVIDIKSPYLRVTDLYQTAENVYTVRGTTNFADATPLLIKIDEDRYYSQENDSFTYKTAVKRPYTSTMGMFEYNMLMPIQEMTPGWHYLTIYSGELVTEMRFKIDEQEWGPAPTPTEYVKYLSNGDIAPVYVTVVQEKIIDHYIDRWHTATPTPAITDALGDKVGYPYSRGEQIPGWVALLATFGIAGLVLVRDWKWKK
jgi:hypothetical protein